MRRLLEALDPRAGDRELPAQTLALTLEEDGLPLQILAAVGELTRLMLQPVPLRLRRLELLLAADRMQPEAR